MKKRTYLISLSLAAGLALSQLTGCASSGPEETTAAESTQAPSEAETASIPNPMEEVENEQSFESMGIHMVAPADGENTKFYTISGEVAEITFDENGVSYCTGGSYVNPLQRPPIRERMEFGIKAIDSMLTIGKGQRIGIFAGSGVGKSTLMAEDWLHGPGAAHVIPYTLPLPFPTKSVPRWLPI